LAERLGVDFTTVTRAYGEARGRGLLDAVTGRGSFIAAREASAGFSVDLSMNIPPAPQGVRLGELMRRGLDELLRRSDVDRLMTYQVSGGALADRSAGAAWLAPLVGTVDARRVVAAAGAQPALAALIATSVVAGGAVLSDALTYPGFIAAARAQGARIVPVAADDYGMRPDALDRAAKAHGVRLLFLSPTIHNPTAITMPESRRHDILRVAQARDLTIIEDDPYALLAGDAPPPFAALAPERVFYISTLSKTLTPGLRTAFVLAPPDRDSTPLIASLRALTQMPAPLMTALAAHWIRIGAAGELLRGVRREAAARQELARKILPASARAHPNGLHVWQPLPPQWDRFRLIEEARRASMGVTPSDAFNVEGRAPDAIRLSLGGVPERARLAEALRAITAIIASGRAVERAVV
ncbi:MAG: PLP-dependent aminotransferase family protein, partial [Rhizobiales bacterium]|nr:PLP-dependent aminotransferase family protein [Hyphomicrobiales bacterium]